MGVVTIIWERWVEFKREFFKNTLAAAISPLLYLIAFGWGIQAAVDGRPYVQYLIPGLLALTTMNVSFSSTAVDLNIQRLYEKAFEQVMISPTPMWQFVLGHAVAGCLRGVYAGLLVLLMSLLTPAGIRISAMLFALMLLNGMMFSSLGVAAAIISQTHAGTARFSNFVILPMSFLCNTFFSTGKLPVVLRQVVAALPLSQASGIMRSLAYGEAFSFAGIAIILAYTAAFFAIAFVCINKKKNL